jgi:hypothetical protein
VRKTGLAALADQLNHDLTHLQSERTEGVLRRLVEELGRPTQPIVPRELPPRIADFTGREDELATLLVLLTTSPADTGRPVVISAIDGMGGVGKSALAIQVAHELADAGTFPDGQLYVNLRGTTPGLAPLDPLEALGRMLQTLGVEPAQIPTEATRPPPASGRSDDMWVGPPIPAQGA